MWPNLSVKLHFLISFRRPIIWLSLMTCRFILGIQWSLIRMTLLSFGYYWYLFLNMFKANSFWLEFHYGVKGKTIDCWCQFKSNCRCWLFSDILFLFELFAKFHLFEWKCSALIDWSDVIVADWLIFPLVLNCYKHFIICD